MPVTDFDAYLLGRMSASEREALEERFFGNAELFEAVQAGEDDLILRYLKGELLKEDREQFEREYLRTPAHRSRVEFMRDLSAVVGRAPEAPAQFPAGGVTPRQSSPSLTLYTGFAALALIAITLAGWLAFQVARLRVEVARSERNSEELNQQIAQLKLEPQPEAKEEASSADAQRRPVLPVSFALLPGIERGNTGQLLLIPSGAESVRLHLATSAEQSYPEYRVRVRTPEGTQIWGTRAKSTRSIELPASLLRAGDYVLILEGARPAGGFETLDDYAFRVVRKP
jgi:anti-sigma factor RsiW